MSKNKRLRIVIAVFLLSLITYGAVAQPPFGGRDDTAFAAALWQTLVEARLVGPEAIDSKPYSGRHPHGAVLQTLKARVTMDEQTNDALVTRNYGGPGVSLQQVAERPAEYLRAVTVMFKRPGYDPDNQNWFWAKYLPDGSLDKNPKGILLAGRVSKGNQFAGCIACHRAAPGGDFLFGR